MEILNDKSVLVIEIPYTPNSPSVIRFWNKIFQHKLKAEEEVWESILKRITKEEYEDYII